MINNFFDAQVDKGFKTFSYMRKNEIEENKNKKKENMKKEIGT